MISLRESLEELVELSANRILRDGSTLEGRQALARMAWLMWMLDHLDACGGSWDECDLLPESIRLLTIRQSGSWADTLH